MDATNAKDKQPAGLTTIPVEIRLRIFKYLCPGSIIWVPGQPKTTWFPIALRAQPEDFPWEITAIDRKTRKEALAILLPSTMIWFYNEWTGITTDISESIPPAYLAGIKCIRQFRSFTQPAGFSELPSLKVVEICTIPFAWVPRDEHMLVADFDYGNANSVLVRKARRNILNDSCTSARWLVPLLLNPNRGFKIIVSNIVYLRLPSMVEMLGIRGSQPVPDQDDQDATFELLYHWDSGHIVAGKELIAEAVALAEHRFAYDAFLDERFEMRSHMSDLCQADVDNAQDEWYHRAGEVYITEGRVWAWCWAIEQTYDADGPAPASALARIPA